MKSRIPPSKEHNNRYNNLNYQKPKLMKKFITPFAMMMLAAGFAAQANAQKYYNRASDPATEIVPGTQYMLQNPWVGEYQMLSGTGTTSQATEETLYEFVDTGKKDADGNTLYYLKQSSTGLYLENPDLSNGKVSMTESVARAFVFTALKGEGIATFKENEQETEEWKAGDIRKKYWTTANNTVHENVFVLCNEKHESSTYDWFGVWAGNVNSCTWTQYVEAHIWQLYTATEASAYDNLCNALPAILPNGTENLFVAGDQPGQVADDLIRELDEAYTEANNLINSPNEKDEVYYNALERVKKALAACKDGIVPITVGYYVIDNNPTAGRPSYAGTTNACLTDTDGLLRWAGFNKPETMTVSDASFIWEVKEAEDGGYYLRNYGTNRYAGSLNQNFQCVPSSETASQVYDITYRNGEYFSLDMRGQNATYPSLHADQNTDKKIVIWAPDAGASQWVFRPVDKSELEGIENELNQNRLNQKGQKLYSSASTDYNKGFVYSAEGCTRDGVFNVGDGLITKAEQLVSNAMESPDLEPGNAYENLIDNNFETYFHTVWSDASKASSYHYLDIKLDEAVKDFNIKYSCRHNNDAGSPTKIHVYASNDTTNGNWSDQGYMTCTYPWSAQVGETTKQNFAGVASHQLDKEYTYVRLEVENTKSMNKTNGNLFWYWSELRMYKSTYDASLSLIEAVPADVRKALEDAMAKVKQELADKAVKQESLDELQAAYDKFLENYPDPQIIHNLMKEAEAQAENAVEGEELGYFKTGAKEALQTALAEVKSSIKEVMTVAEIKAAKDKINAALKTFNAQLIVPEDGAFYFIKSATSSEAEGSARDNYLYAQNNDESQVKYGLPDDITTRIEYMWKSVKNEDGSYSFINSKTGTAIGNPKENNNRVNMSYETDSVTLRSAKVGGQFNFVCAENVYYNAQPGTNNLVTWNSADGSDNSAFIFEPVGEDSWDGSVYHEFTDAKAEIVTLPFAISGEALSCKTYKVLGLKDKMLQLAAYGAEETIPAATPFFIIPEEGEASAMFFREDTNLSNIEYSFDGQEQNGLKGTLKSTSDVAGGGILFEGKIISAVASDKVKSNSGYFVTMPKETTEAGDYTMEFPENIETAIEEIILTDNSKSKAGVYTMTGVKVRNTNNVQGLPTGLYIVAGKKIYVK